MRQRDIGRLEQQHPDERYDDRDRAEVAQRLTGADRHQRQWTSTDVMATVQNSSIKYKSQPWDARIGMRLERRYDGSRQGSGSPKEQGR